MGKQRRNKTQNPGIQTTPTKTTKSITLAERGTVEAKGGKEVLEGGKGVVAVVAVAAIPPALIPIGLTMAGTHVVTTTAVAAGTGNNLTEIQNTPPIWANRTLPVYTGLCTAIAH